MGPQRPVLGPILEALLDGYLAESTLSYVQMAQGPMGPWAWGGPK